MLVPARDAINEDSKSVWPQTQHSHSTVTAGLTPQTQRLRGGDRALLHECVMVHIDVEVIVRWSSTTVARRPARQHRNPRIKESPKPRTPLSPGRPYTDIAQPQPQHSTVTAQSQHSHSTVTVESGPPAHRHSTAPSRHSHGHSTVTVTAQSPLSPGRPHRHRHSTAQSRHSHR